MPCSQYRAFLADIAEHPSDDTPRMIFADWLEDQDQAERAEFIRLQCRLAGLGPEAKDLPLLRRRIKELEQRHRSEWREELPVLPGVNWGEFSRGFVESAFVQSLGALLEQAEVVFSFAPIRRLRIGTIDDREIAQLAEKEWLSQLVELNLGNNTDLTIRGIRSLVRSPHLSNMESLLLHYCGLGDSSAIELAQTPSLPNLKELYLSGNDLSDTGASAVAESLHFPRLTDLDLRDNRIGDPGAFTLAATRERQSLETLFLVNNRLGPDGVTALAWTPHLPHLRNLYLNYNLGGDPGAIALANSAQRQSLREIDLRHAGITNPGGQALAVSCYLDNVQGLWLSGNRFSSATVQALRRRFGDQLHL